MKKLTASALVLFFAVVLGAREAAAEVKTRFVLENSETGETGNHISARAGDKLVLKLFVKNEAKADATISTDLTAAIPDCVVNANDTSSYKMKKNKKFQRVEIVPGDLPAGTVLTLHAESLSSLGNTDSDDASVTLVSSKASAGTADRGGMFQRIFLRAMVRAVLASDQTDQPALIDTHFGDVKSLFR